MAADEVEGMAAAARFRTVLLGCGGGLALPLGSPSPIAGFGRDLLLPSLSSGLGSRWIASGGRELSLALEGRFAQMSNTFSSGNSSSRSLRSIEDIVRDLHVRL